MIKLIDQILLIGIAAVTAILTLTAIPVLFGGHLEGLPLLVHMMASGALVIGLPLLALWQVGNSISQHRSGAMQRWGFWLLMLTGVITIASIFACMLPVPPTEQMHALLDVHGYAGFAMVPALALLFAGTSRWRRIQSTRSATPG